MKERLIARWDELRRQHWWLEHLVRAWQRYKKNNGDYFAAAITYFSFLALFPTILLGVSITGYVLQHDQSLQTQLYTKIEHGLPGGFGTTVKQAVSNAISARAGVGVVGLLGLAYTGLGWIANLRAAIIAVWGQTPAKIAFVKAKLLDSAVLAGLGLGVVLSVGLTAVGTALTDQVTRKLSIPGGTVLVTLFGLLLPVAGDMLVFGLVLIRLPKAKVPRPILIRTVMLASIGFEILKVIGTFYIARVAKSPAFGVLGGIIGILVWIDLVSRFILYCASWAATASSPGAESTASSAVDVAIPADAPVTRSAAASPLTVAASLVGIGFTVGAGSVGLLRRRLRSAGDG